jgi:hypothetical protein
LGEDAARSTLGNSANKSIERYIQVQEESDLNIVRMTAEIRRGKLPNLSQNVPPKEKA